MESDTAFVLVTGLSIEEPKIHRTAVKEGFGCSQNLGLTLPENRVYYPYKKSSGQFKACLFKLRPDLGVRRQHMTSELVTIHGDQWKLSDIREETEWVKSQCWEFREWKPRAALVSKGKVSEYVGQKYQPQYTELVDDGWTHDHCEICWWSIHESEDKECGEGYTTDGRTWICKECFKLFVKDNDSVVADNERDA